MTYQRTAAAIIAAMLAAAPAAARPLAEELQALLAEHPLLKSVRSSVRASGKSRLAAAAGNYPRVSISADTGPEKIVNPTTETDLRRQRMTATVEQNLFAGGRTAATVELAELDYALQDNNLGQTTQDILLEAITAYLQVGRYQTLIAIARRNEETTQRQLALENQRVERGGGIAVDVMQARARLQLVKERRVFYQQGLRDAVASYHQVFGHPPEFAKLQDLDIFAERIPATLEAALEQGRQANPRLREAMLQSKTAQKQIALERAGMYPSVDLVGTRIKDKNANAVTRRDESSVLLKFSWNVFSGLETTYRTQASGIHYEATLEREANVTNKADETVRIAWNQLINGREREELLDSAAGISYDVMQNRKRLRDAGKETAINVLDAEVEYYGVLSNKLNAASDTRIGSYRLLAAMGALSPAALGLDGGRFALPVRPLVLDPAAVVPAPASRVPGAAADGKPG